MQLLIIFILIIFIINIYLLSIQGAGYDKLAKYKYFEPCYSRLLTMREEPYDETRPEYTKITLKCGQRKLLFNELEFYNYCVNKWGGLGRKFIVIYAGAAEGYHSDFIMEMYPDFYFEYSDPRRFYKKLYQYKNLCIDQSFFTRNTAIKMSIKYQNREKYFVLFLSDIRLGSEEEYVAPDMEYQREWCDIIKPDYAMLKFRLPWKAGSTEYYAGEIYTQPRIGPTSTEMRLWTDCKSYKAYNNYEYNNRCFYWNIHIRLAHHSGMKKYMRAIPGLCDCYDCWSEIQILKGLFREEKKIIDYMQAIEKRFPINLPPHNFYMKDIWAKIIKFKSLNH